MDKNEIFVSWMNDAYQMEQSMIPALEHQISRAQDYPALQTRLTRHLDETHHHADVVRGCLDRLGKSPAESTEPAVTTHDGEAATDGASRFDLVHDGIYEFSSESLEVAMYHTLVTASRDVGQMECERAFQEILKNEQDMVAWLDENLPLLVEQTVRHAA